MEERFVTNKTMKTWPLGWKAKIGIILPSTNTGYYSYELRVISPEGVVTLETRVMGGKLTIETLRRMREDVVYAAKLLAVGAPSVITYEATAAGFILGVDGEKALIKEIQDTTGIRATTGSESVTESLRFLGIKKMILYAATPEEITLKSLQYFESLGLEVPVHESFGGQIGSEINGVSPWETYSNVMRLYRKYPDADGIFISGGGLRTLEMIETLEKDSGLPVVSTVVANMWHCLKLSGVNDLVRGFGQLLERDRIS
jgi:maleate cis-trans isomerase